MSFFAKIPGGTKWALIVFGVVVLQYALAFFARLATLPALGALHGAQRADPVRRRRHGGDAGAYGRVAPTVRDTADASVA